MLDSQPKLAEELSGGNHHLELASPLDPGACVSGLCCLFKILEDSDSIIYQVT